MSAAHSARAARRDHRPQRVALDGPVDEVMGVEPHRSSSGGPSAGRPHEVDGHDVAALPPPARPPEHAGRTCRPAGRPDRQGQGRLVHGERLGWHLGYLVAEDEETAWPRSGVRGEARRTARRLVASAHRARPVARAALARRHARRPLRRGASRGRVHRGPQVLERALPVPGSPPRPLLPVRDLRAEHGLGGRRARDNRADPVRRETLASFLALLCCEQIRTDVAFPGLPVRLIGHHSGFTLGFYGSSHHATEDIAIMRSLAGLAVVAPADGPSLAAALRATIGHPGPIYFRIARGRDPDLRGRHRFRARPRDRPRAGSRPHADRHGHRACDARGSRDPARRGPGCRRDRHAHDTSRSTPARFSRLPRAPAR